ncbi:MAG: trypsin-like peptidase domain-containing protein [Proteobacteria bacterium]|nr:trypsin-like peptidase domain-containing protein [Pseudomonadota bacterium]MBU4468940.1 trypsin-like peptidase domain-containing protein [Pseudomonadota bacterium]MCG2751176.1 trypsin-like peptidase domain-containing protein [Desulfobacteraceae bacterium]
MKNKCISGFLLIVFLLLGSNALYAARNDCLKSIPEIYNTVSPSTVLISCTTTDQLSVKNKVLTLYGSGFIFSEDGLILTNAHLVFKSSSIIVKMSGRGAFPATIVGMDPVMDIAVLKIQDNSGKVPIVTFMKDDERIEIGEEVVVIGSPEGMENTISRGIVSGLNRILPSSPMSMVVPMIQTDAPVSMGNSGGPILNRCGEVIGMVTAVLNHGGNIGFALPIHDVKQALTQLIENGRIKRPWLGIRGKLISKTEIESIFKIIIADGFLVESVDSGSPAENVGIKGGTLPIIIAGEEFLFGGDIILSGNGLLFDKLENFEAFVRNMKIGDNVKLSVFREGTPVDVEFVVPERPVLPEDLPLPGRKGFNP